jgi:SAM-dependent methyltransferase
MSLAFFHPTAAIQRPERYRRLENAREYDRHWSRPNILRQLSLALEMSAFQRAIDRVTGRRVLDAPCGTGRLQSILDAKFAEVASLDSSLAMLTVFRQKNPRAGLCCADIFNLPFRGMEWDWVVCYRLFHHLKSDSERVRLLKSIGRVSRQGVVFTAWIDTPLNRRCGSRRRTISREALEKIIETAGLELVSLDFAAWPVQPKCVVTSLKSTNRNPYQTRLEN